MNIVLCGFMGSGKTTIGRVLARYSGYEFVDMDNYIEQTQGMKIPEIFDQYGEPGFRQIETQACRDLGATDGRVIATGGGALLKEENADALRKNGTIFFLDPPFPVILSRLRASKVPRPVIMGRTDGEIRAIYDARIGAYARNSDVRMTLSAPPQEFALEILQRAGIHPSSWNIL